MGSLCCADKGTAFERKVTKEIDDRLQSGEASLAQSSRILFLGPGESGKSTIMKQMIKVHRGSIPTDTLQWSVSKIKNEVVQMMKTLCRASIDLHIELDTTSIDDDKRDIHSVRDIMCDIVIPPDITPDTVSDMKLLWSNKGIRETLAERHKFQIADHVAYWYNSRLDDIYLSDAYIPTFSDYLRLRIRSTGCVEETFTSFMGHDGIQPSSSPPPLGSLQRLDSASNADQMGSHAELVRPNDSNSLQHTITFVDVGGQRCERKKWFNMMKDNINCVVYVVAISEYDMMCAEDEKTPRMTEALNLFETVLEKGFMDGNDKTVTLFFNKYDLLVEKLENKRMESFRNYYKDFPMDKDDRNPKDICDFIFSKFENLYAKYKQNENIHYHCTTAMDTNQIQNVINDIVFDIIKAINSKISTFLA